MSLKSVLVVGGTGNTGQGIIRRLHETKKYHVIVGVRSASASKPVVTEFKSIGVEVRFADLSTFNDSQFDELVRGVDVVISTIFNTELEKQKPLIDAAKRAGAQRFIPDDWGTAGVPGVRVLYDAKEDIHQYIKDKGPGYTFIDVGFWYELLIPADGPKPGHPELEIVPRTSHKFYGTGDVPTAIIDRSDIGKFVARIIDDPRTLNRYVFCYGDHKSLNEMWDTARKVNKDLGKTLNAAPKPVSEAELLQVIKSSKHPYLNTLEYMFSMYVRGDNTVENAKKPEYGNALDVRELYPEIAVRDFEEFAKWFYSL